jgi:hypothetical protein
MSITDEELKPGASCIYNGGKVWLVRYAKGSKTMCLITCQSGGFGLKMVNLRELSAAN